MYRAFRALPTCLTCKSKSSLCFVGNVFPSPPYSYYPPRRLPLHWLAAQPPVEKNPAKRPRPIIGSVFSGKKIILLGLVAAGRTLNTGRPSSHSARATGAGVDSPLLADCDLSNLPVNSLRDMAPWRDTIIFGFWSIAERGNSGVR